MSEHNVAVPSSVRWMRVLVVVVLVAVVAYTALMMVERTGAATLSVRGSVVDKRHVAAHRTYVTEIINGRSVVVPREVADAYVIELSVPGGRTTGVIPQELYDRLATGDSVTVEIRRRRISRAIDVLQVSR